MPNDKPTSRQQKIGTLIVGGLMAVVALGALAPAVARVREIYNRHSCQSNLRMLVTAAHNFHNDYGFLPPGYLGPQPNETDPKPDNGPHIGWIPYILPYLLNPGEGEAHNRAACLPNIRKGDYEWQLPPERGWWLDPARLSFACTQYEVLRCPSAPRASAGADGEMGMVVALHHYNVSGQQSPSEHMTAITLPLSPESRGLGVTNYVGVSGALGEGTHRDWGVFCGVALNRKTLSLGQISAGDGASCTLYIGESLGGYTYRELKILHTWMGSGAMGVAAGLGHPKDSPSIHQFSSSHRGLVNFCFADGSVRTIRSRTANKFPSPDILILLQLAGRKDGGIMGLPK